MEMFKGEGDNIRRNLCSLFIKGIANKFFELSRRGPETVQSIKGITAKESKKEDKISFIPLYTFKKPDMADINPVITKQDIRVIPRDKKSGIEGNFKNKKAVINPPT